MKQRVIIKWFIYSIPVIFLAIVGILLILSSAKSTIRFGSPPAGCYQVGVYFKSEQGNLHIGDSSCIKYSVYRTWDGVAHLSTYTTPPAFDPEARLHMIRESLLKQGIRDFTLRMKLEDGRRLSRNSE